MAISIPILASIVSLHLFAFVLAVGAERRRSTGNPVPDKYDETTYCAYTTDASSWYGMAAFFSLVISQGMLYGITRCLCFGRKLRTGTSSACCARTFFVVSWVFFLGAAACLCAGSAKNAYHTKYRTTFHVGYLSCATLRKGVFAAGAALTLLSLFASVAYYWAHSKAATGGWQKHRNEGVDMDTSSFPHPQQPTEFEKA